MPSENRPAVTHMKFNERAF